MICPTPICVPNPELKSKPYLKGTVPDKLWVPCGKCFSCLSNMRSDWIFRLKQEMKACTTSAFFLTFTYQDEFLPMCHDASYPTLCKLDIKTCLHRFFHSSRPIMRMKMRYFLVGEYGEENDRPHYHTALFGWQGDNVSLVNALEDYWQFGGIHCLYLSGALIGYITKYMLKQYDDDWFKDKPDDIERPFRLMSKGLGQKGFVNKSMAKYLARNNLPSCVNDGDFLRRIPRYFYEKIYQKFGSTMVQDRNFSKFYRNLPFGFENSNPDDCSDLLREARKMRSIRDFEKYQKTRLKYRPYLDDIQINENAERRSRKADAQKQINKKFKQ